MIDPSFARLAENIQSRNVEILSALKPGFQPVHDDVRARPRVLAANDPLTVEAPPDARFIIAGAQGRQSYTREGTFVCRDGRLELPSGEAVLGYSGTDATLGEIRIARNDRLCGRVQHLRVERGGELVYERETLDPRNGLPQRERVVAGTLALARFPAGTETVRSGNAERAPLGVAPHLGRPADGGFAALTLGRCELGELDLNTALARLHDAYQQLDAVAAATRAAHIGTAKTALDLVK